MDTQIRRENYGLALARVNCLVDSAMEKRMRHFGGQKKAEKCLQVKMEMSFEMRYEFLYVPRAVKYFCFAKLFSS